MEMLLKWIRKQNFQNFTRRTLIDQVNKKKMNQKNQEKVVIFPTCFVNYNNPDLGLIAKKY